MAEHKLRPPRAGWSDPAANPVPLGAGDGLRQVFIRDLVLPCNIGVHRHEKAGPQRVRINLDLAVRDNGAPIEDSLGNVVCYEAVANGVRAIVAAGHINLVETLAERIAEFCLADLRIEAARVRVEKLDVFAEAASVGTEILRRRL